jgi:hypothetical protein
MMASLVIACPDFCPYYVERIQAPARTRLTGNGASLLDPIEWRRPSLKPREFQPEK